MKRKHTLFIFLASNIMLELFHSSIFCLLVMCVWHNVFNILFHFLFWIYFFLYTHTHTNKNFIIHRWKILQVTFLSTGFYRCEKEAFKKKSEMNVFFTVFFFFLYFGCSENWEMKCHRFREPSGWARKHIIALMTSHFLLFRPW